MQKLQVNKPSGPNSIPTKILKFTKDHLSGYITIPGPFSEVINKFFLTGIFWNVIKIAKVVPVIKAESRIQNQQV